MVARWARPPSDPGRDRTRGCGMGTSLKHRARRMAGMVVMVAVVASCGRESPVAPQASVGGVGGSSKLLGGLLDGLVSCAPLPQSQAGAWIGANGGTLHIGPHTFTVPAGALSHPVFIRAVAPTGSAREVEFAPQGLRFAVPASLTLSFAHCSLLVHLLPQIAYVDDSQDILSFIPSLADLLSQTVTGQVSHFSGYAVAYRR